MREERIERLLKELQYEVTRGMMEGEIEERIGFEFFVPVSKNIRDGVVHCIFQTRPTERHFNSNPDGNQPRLKVVK